jgi:hypothetical protein
VSGLEEEDRCHFVYHEAFQIGADWGADEVVNVTQLVPRVSWHERIATIDCAGGANCISMRRYPRLMPTPTFFLFRLTIKQDADPPKMEKALLHLLELCGVRPEKPDPF